MFNDRLFKNILILMLQRVCCVSKLTYKKKFNTEKKYRYLNNVNR